MIFSTQIAYASVDTVVAKIDSQIINPLIALIFALALVYFLYGVFEFIANQDNEEKKTTGKRHMIWGVIGITIMMGVWTILNVILSTLNIKYIDPQNGKVDLPAYTPSKTF